MARKVVNRKALREEAEAAEKAEKSGAKTKKKKAARKKSTRSRSKSSKEVRLKAYWGVYNQSLKRVALFEYSEKSAADKKAKELSDSQKSPHFVQPVKEAIEE